jgi:lipopolysaccharide/colanic/teichoic acid biosynthesis glycosyltransferase
VIFCAKDVPAQVIIDKMSELSVSQVEIKIAPPESLAIIGSKSINTSGDIYIIELDSISSRANKRSKRLLDLLISIVLIVLSPILVFYIRKPLRFLKNLIFVFAGKKTFVGYRLTDGAKQSRLPDIKPGILNPTDVLKNNLISDDTIGRLNLLYARDYQVINDLNIIYRRFRELGR